MDNTDNDLKLSFHQIISKKITYLLDNLYYNNVKKLYNDTLNNIFNYKKIPILKPEYFIFSNYYFIYTFFYYISNKNSVLYSLSLHMTHISPLLYDNLLLKYDYNPSENTCFLKNNSYFLFNYLLFFKILLFKTEFYKKLLITSSIYIFYILYTINDIYKERLKCIIDKKEFNHHLKILVFTPNKKLIETIIRKTNFFSYSNYLFLINLILILFF